MRRRTLTPTALALALAALLAGCADDGDRTAATGRPAGAGSASGTPLNTQGAAPGETPSPEASTAPKVAVSTARTVPTGKPAQLTDEVVVTVVGIRTVEVTASQPGEIAGAAVAVEVLVRNKSGSAFPVDGLAVNATTADGRALDITSAAPSKQLAGSVSAGSQGRGTYVFTLPPGAKAAGLRLEVLSDRAVRVLQFKG